MSEMDNGKLVAERQQQLGAIDHAKREQARKHHLQLVEILSGLSLLKTKVLDMLEEIHRPAEVPPPPPDFDMGRFWFDAPPPPEDVQRAALAGEKTDA